MENLKVILRRFPVYLWIANQYRALRRLFIYPETANVGVTDYDEYWQHKAPGQMGALSPYRMARAQTIGGVLKRDDVVLDLGVGDGAILKHLIDMVGIDGYGLDISADAVKFCQSQGLNVELGDINQPLGAFIDRHFDAIVMAEIIEHIPDPENLLNALRPHARLLIVTTPNTGYFHHRLRLLFGKFPLQWVVTPGEHLRFWTVRDFQWWAAQLGFRITHQSAYTGTPILRRLWPNLFGQGMMYVLEEASNLR